MERIIETGGKIALGIGIAAFVLAAIPVWLVGYGAYRLNMWK